MRKNLLFFLAIFVISISLNAQVANYVFDQNVGTYTPITGGTVVDSGRGTTGAASLDDVIFNLPDGTIPFTFTFDGNGYTGLNISSNGFITFGATPPTTSTYTPISATTTYNGAISAFGRDLQAGWVTSGDRTTGSAVISNIANLGPAQVGDFISGTGIPAGATIISIAGNEITMSANATSTGTLGPVQVIGPWANIRYETLGTAPNRVFVLQYSNFKRFGTTLTTVQHMSLNFQFRLYETSNKIEIVYNNCSPGLTTFATVNQVGLRGPNNTFATNVNNRLNVKGTNDNWLNSSQGTLNSSGMLFNNVAPANEIPNGLTYSWTVPVVGAPEISYVLLTNTYLTGNRNLNGVSITTSDPNGIATGANAPRIYWKVNSGSWQSAATSSSSSPYNFTIGTTGLNLGDTVRYFVIAQTAVTNVVSSNPSAGLVATSVNDVTTPPNSPNSYFIVTNWNFGSNGQTGNNLYFFANSTAGANDAPTKPDFIWRDTTGSIDIYANDVANPNFPLLNGGLDDGVWQVSNALGGKTIRFFGTDYTDFYIGSNGIVSFQPFTSSSANWQPPAGGVPQASVLNAIFPFWTDLNPSSTAVPISDRRISFKVTQDELIITYNKIPVYAASGFTTDPNRYITFQVNIEFSNPNPTKNSRIFVSYNDTLSGSLLITEYNANALRTNLVGLQAGNGADSVVVYRYQSVSSLVTPGNLFGSSLTVGFAPDSNNIPVELTSLSAIVENRNVNIYWSTATEFNNRGFEIQRNTSDLTNTEWITLGFVQGQGSTLTPQEYSFVDKQLNSGKYNYRIKQIDFDGTFNYYNLSNEVEIGLPFDFELSQNYPNPFNPSTRIEYQIPVNAKVEIELYNITGEKVATLINNELEAGYYNVDIDAKSLKLASGVYFYRFISTDINGKQFMDIKKMMLLK